MLGFKFVLRYLNSSVKKGLLFEGKAVSLQFIIKKIYVRSGGVVYIYNFSILGG